MKNLFSRLTRLMIIMLMLVDRTPFFNVYASDDFKLEIDYTDSLVNAGLGLGNYDKHLKPLDSTWPTYCPLINVNSTSAEIETCLAFYGVTPASILAEILADENLAEDFAGFTFSGFKVLKIEKESNGNDMKFVGIAALLLPPNLPAIAVDDTSDRKSVV